MALANYFAKCSGSTQSVPYTIGMSVLIIHAEPELMKKANLILKDFKSA